MEEEMVIEETLNPQEPQDSNPEYESTIMSDEELAKAQELAKNYKIRAEKAEQELKKLKTVPAEKETPKNDGLSLKDIRALQDVSDDDVEDVTEYAKFKGISIAEAKKSPVIVSLLKARAEERATAQAANVGTTRKATRRDSDETILENFNKGVVSEKDEDIQKLVEAQFAKKKAALKR